jgi:hypothetical protein
MPESARFGFTQTTSLRKITGAGPSPGVREGRWPISSGTSRRMRSCPSRSAVRPRWVRSISTPGGYPNYLQVQAESNLSAKRYSSWWVVRFVLLLGVSPGDDLAVGPRHLRNLAHPSRT